MGRAVLIILLGSLSIYIIVNLSINSRLNDSLSLSIEYLSSTHARNIANSVAQIELSNLADSSDYRVNVPTTKVLFDGTAEYYVRDTTINTDDYIVISVTGEYNDFYRNVKVFTIPAGGFVPTSVKAAITANNPVVTLGNLVVDGRDHDSNGNLISNSGTKAIWTTGVLQRKGNSKLGSTSSGFDYTPQKAENNNLRLENQVYPGGYPNTADSLLGGAANGFPAGELKSIALSGDNGSQYATNPGTLTYPLKGVTYVEMPGATTWNPVNINGSGILIVHNSTSNSIMKNLNFGTFKGLIIADDVDKVHADIIGALITMTPHPSSGNCIGNGSGSIKFSSKAIEDATGTITGGTPNNYGFGNSRIKPSDWYE